jgi:hypothetical protein
MGFSHSQRAHLISGVMGASTPVAPLRQGFPPAKKVWSLYLNRQKRRQKAQEKIRWKGIVDDLPLMSMSFFSLPTPGAPEA